MPVEAIPDTQLGLTSEEIHILRQGQATVNASSTTNASSSSRAASRASSQGLLLLDTTSLTALSRYFDRLMANIEHNIRYLSEQAQMFTQLQYDHAGNVIDGADAEIARYTDILRQLDELDMDFDRIANVKDIVKGYRARVEALERDLESSGGGSSSSRHRHGHSHSSGHHHSSKHGHSSSSHRHGHSSSSSHRHRR